MKEETEEQKTNPFKYIIMVFLILLMVMWIIPASSIKTNPNPSKIPELDEVTKNLINSNPQRLQSIYDIKDLQISTFLKQAAANIGKYCENSEVCFAKAFFYFTRDKISYIPDPDFEYIENPDLTLISGAADCDGKSILLSGLLNTVGITNRIVIGNNHAFVQAHLPDAFSIYKTEEDWVSLDPSCTNCEFGKVSPQYLKNNNFIFT